MLRAAGYVRVSSQGQVEDGYSLAEQEAAIRAYCERRGLALAEIQRDAGLSGTLQERPAVTRTLQLIQQGEVNAVVTAKLDRLGRGARIIHQVLGSFRDAGARVLYTDVEIPDNAAGRLLENVLIGVAEFDLESIKGRLAAGKRQKLTEKRVPPSRFRCLGLRQITRAESEVFPQHAGCSGQIIIVEEEAEVVRELFRRVAAGETLYAVAAWAEAQGWRGLQGGHYTSGSLSALLRQPAYMGEVHWGKKTWRATQELTDGGRRKVVGQTRPPEEQSVLPCPAIIDRATWEAVAARLADNLATIRGRPSESFVLRGIVRCGVCQGRRGPLACWGERMTRRRNSKLYARGYYRCGSAHLKNHEFCGSRMSAARLEPLVAARLEAALRPGEFGRLARAEVEAAVAHAGDAAQEIERLEGLLEKLRRQEQALLSAYLDGFGVEAVRTKHVELQAQRALLSSQLAEHQARLPRAADADLVAAEAEAVAATARAQWEAAQGNPAELHRLYQRFLRVRLFPAGPPDVSVILPLRT